MPYRRRWWALVVDRGWWWVAGPTERPSSAKAEVASGCTFWRATGKDAQALSWPILRISRIRYTGEVAKRQTDRGGKARVRRAVRAVAYHLSGPPTLHMDKARAAGDASPAAAVPIPAIPPDRAGIQCILHPIARQSRVWADPTVTTSCTKTCGPCLSPSLESPTIEPGTRFPSICEENPCCLFALFPPNDGAP